MSKRENIPCRLAYKTLLAADGQGIQSASQVAMLFLAPDVIVVPGSDIDVFQNGREWHFTSSGVPAVMQSHQEVALAERVKYHGNG